jgi:hypothetical protein
MVESREPIAAQVLVIMVLQILPSVWPYPTVSCQLQMLRKRELLPYSRVDIEC